MRTRKQVTKIYCHDCKATMVYADKATANFMATTHADLYNHDVSINLSTVETDPLFELEGY